MHKLIVPISRQAALVNTKNITPNNIFNENHKLPGNGKKLNKGNHPPKNKIDEKALIEAY